MDSVAGRPQLVGKRQEPRRLPLRVMKQEYRCHHGTVASLRPAFNAPQAHQGSRGMPSRNRTPWTTSAFLIQRA